MPKKRENFSETNLSLAISAVLNDGLSKKAASRQFNVSRSTLQHRLKNPDIKTTCGPNTVLTNEEEKLLVNWILECSRKGFPQRKEDLQLSVKHFLEHENRPNPFKDNVPGIGWYKAFMRRHPSISVRTSEHVAGASANVSEKDIKKWFLDIHTYLEDNGLSDILNEPARLFNGDETGFSLCPKTKNVLAPKGCKDVYEVATGNPKENLTVMFTFNALGEMCNPMIIYNYKRIPQDIVNSVPTNWGVGHSDTGWMKSETFYEYIANIFHPYLIEKGITLPVILFVDGHKSHLTYQLSQLCSELEIILIALYPNSTRILQPADVAAFRPLKAGWRNGVFEWRKKNNNMCKAVSKKDFAPILNKVIEETVKPDTLKNGFKACGLFPWNPNEIDYQKCLGKNGPLIEIDKESVASSETSISHTLINDNNLNMTMFSEIVGLETMEKLKNIKRTEQFTEEFSILHRLFEKLKKNADYDQANELSSAVLENVELNRDNMLTSLLEENEPLNASPICHNDTVFHETTSVKKKVTTFNENQQATVKKLKVSPLQECLVWPVTPERKGKRQTERLPFVISSQMWQNMHEHKENLKNNINEEKEKRKRKREENKLLKSNKEPTTNNFTSSNKRKIVKNLFSETVTSQTLQHKPKTLESPTFVEQLLDEDTIIINEVNSSEISGKCVNCNDDMNCKDIGYACSFCNDKYHKRCINKSSYCDISLDINVLFICKTCESSINIEK